MLADNLPQSSVGNSTPVITYERSKSVASALVLANLNSLPLDWATRLSVGGVNMNFLHSQTTARAVAGGLLGNGTHW